MVSPLALGAMMLGTRTGRDESFAIIDRALDAGINLVDTANVYGRGASEETVGAALARNGKRKNVILATKVHTRMNDTDPNAEGLSRRHVIEQCEASLRRLGTDYIDVYQLHRRRSAVPIDETLRALDDLVRTGKVRYIGTSTFPAWTLVEALWVSRELGLNRFVSEQPPYNLLDRRVERELLPMAATYGFAVVPWSPLEVGCSQASTREKAILRRTAGSPGPIRARGAASARRSSTSLTAFSRWWPKRGAALLSSLSPGARRAPA